MPNFVSLRKERFGHLLMLRLPPHFPDEVVPDGMIRAGFPCDPPVSGHFDRGIQWVTGENGHFAFNSTASSDSNSMGQRSPAMRDYYPYRELDEAFRLTEKGSTVLSDRRRGKNTQHTMLALLRQGVYGRRLTLRGNDP